MELDRLNRGNEIVSELSRIKRVMPSKSSTHIDEHQKTDIVRLVLQNKEEFCKILLKQIERLEKEFNEL